MPTISITSLIGRPHGMMHDAAHISNEAMMPRDIEPPASAARLIYLYALMMPRHGPCHAAYSISRFMPLDITSRCALALLI